MQEALRPVDARLPDQRARVLQILQPRGARHGAATAGQLHPIDRHHVRLLSWDLGQRLLDNAAREHSIVQPRVAEEALEGAPIRGHRSVQHVTNEHALDWHRRPEDPRRDLSRDKETAPLGIMTTPLPV
jgi:hypothetical protein